ncbi:MAG: HD domain-containing protein [Clostridiales bacterium]|nr:HD domain-containing protein [Clostridiales bacterium]
MKKHYIKDLIIGEEVTDFFIAKRAELKIGSNGKQYFDLLLGDKTGEISAKKWDVDGPEEEALSRHKAGDVIKIKALVSEWNGTPQLRVQKIRGLSDSDVIDRSDYIKAAPESPERMYAYITEKAESIEDDEFREVALALLERNMERLLYYPAAKQNHHAIYGGLLYHITRMLMLAERMCEVYDSLSRDLLLTGVIIHDIEKLNEMNADESGVVSEYTFEGQMLGHLVMGVRTIDRLADEIGLSVEKAVMLEHMIISHHYEPDYGSPKKPIFPEAEALHYIDMIDSKLYDFEDALAPVIPGGFTDWIRTLDGRRLYKATTDVKKYSE